MARLTRLVVGMLVGLGIVLALPAIAQQGDGVDALNAEVGRLYREGKYSEAIPLAQRVLAIREKALGPDHADLAVTLNTLAVLYYYQGQYADAELLYKRAFTIDEKALGSTHLNVATDINNLAELYRSQGRYREAEPLYKRALAIREGALGRDHPGVAGDLNNLAVLYYDQGRFAEAEPLYERSLTIREKALGSDHPDVGQALNNLAVLYDAQGRYTEAEPLYKRSLAIREKTVGRDHPDVAGILTNLAVLYFNGGRYPDAEALYKRSLTIQEKALGRDHPDVAVTLNKLAELYDAQGRYADAELLYKRSLAIREHALGPDHPYVGMSLNNLAELYKSQGRYADAEPLYKRALTIREKALGPNHPAVGTTLNNLAGLYQSQRRYDDAEPLYKRSLVIWENALGPGHPDVGRSLNNLAGLYESQGRYDDAEPLYKRSLLIWENALGPDHPDVGHSLNNLAALYFVQSDWARAADFWRRSTRVLIRRVGRGTEAVGPVLTGSGKSEAVQSSWQFWDLIKAGHRLAPEGNAVRAKLAHEMFETAQWGQGSEAAQSLEQMAARSAKGDPALAGLVRERQDLVGEWQGKDKLLIAAKSLVPDKRDTAAERILGDRLTGIDVRIGEIDKQLAQDFPEYAALASPKPLSLADVQSQLREDEALVLFLDTIEIKPVPEETFIWAVTKTDSRWVRSDLGTKSLTEKVQALRCGLDEEEWSGLSGAARCSTLLGIGQPANTDPLPFHLGIAHELYQALFGQVEDLIDGKHLLIVPSGPLTSLPFHVLVTKKPEAALPKTFEGYRGVAWLGRDHAMSVLPSVASLKALRENAKGSRGTKAYLGYGNPALDGDGTCKDIKAPDKCPSLEVANLERPQVVSPGDRAVRATVRGHSGRRSPDLGEMYAKGVAAEAVLANVRSLCPLPDTAYEVRCVAERLGVPASEIRLAASATEADIKALSASGALASYRVVHFATHGLLAGDVELLASRQGEPAIVLTPPKESVDKDDDGLLTASEVAGLKLDADWVVLSACNTASADTLGAEALSGLARAFFYAGARALLVSHWPVYSDAAVRLTTQAFKEIDQSKDGRAVALQRAMIAVMDDPSQNDNAHPAVWAPFVLVGEGAR